MKTDYIIKMIATLCVAFMISGCEEQMEDNSSVDPVFPELVSRNDLKAGDVVTLSFVPDADWSVFVPLDNLLWFWIDNEGVVTDRISGKATSETVTVKIVVSSDVEFNASRSCTVKMTMGSETQVIAELTRMAEKSSMALFAAEFVDGVFETDSLGAYVYGTEEAESLDLVWSEADADFRLPVMVESNVEWTVECPDGIDVNLPESTVGSVKIVFTGESLEAVSDYIVFTSDDVEIARFEVTLPSCAGVNVYEVQSEGGEFLYSEDGGYLYSDDAVDGVTMIWPGTDFRTSIKVESRCNWTLDLPSWVSAEVPEKSAGIVEIGLRGVPSAYPMDEKTGKIAFMLGDDIIHEISITIPGVADHMSYIMNMNLTELEFNSEGALFTTAGYVDGPAKGSYTSTRDSRVLILDTTGGTVREDQDWLSFIALQNWDTSEGADVIQTIEFEISVRENTGGERTGTVIFLPASADVSVADLFDAGTLKEEYSEYAVTILQHGSDMEYVTMLTPSEMAAVGGEFKISENPRLKVDNVFGHTDYAYELTYSNRYARDNAHMSFSKPFASYKVFNAAKSDKTVESETDSLYWLKFTPSSEENTGGVIDMYNGDAAETGYVVFYDSDNATLAVIQCDYDPAVEVTPDFVVEFTEMSMQYAGMTGASLERLTEGELFNEFYDGYTPLYHLKYSMTGMPLKIKVPVSVKKHFVNPYTYRTFFRVNDVIFDEYFGPEDILGEIVGDDEGAVEINMYQPDTVVEMSDAIKLAKGQYMAIIHFTDKADKQVFSLLCTLDLSSDVE